MFEYIQRQTVLTRKPEEIQGWLLMRRAGLTSEQKSLIMAQLGKDLTCEKVATAMQNTFGQQSMPKEKSVKLSDVAQASYDDELYEDHLEYDEEPYDAQDYESNQEESGEMF